MNKKGDALAAREKRLTALLKDLSKCFEFYTYITGNKPETEFDQYDDMMAPIWRRVAAELTSDQVKDTTNGE